MAGPELVSSSEEDLAGAPPGAGRRWPPRRLAVVAAAALAGLLVAAAGRGSAAAPWAAAGAHGGVARGEAEPSAMPWGRRPPQSKQASPSSSEPGPSDADDEEPDPLGPFDGEPAEPSAEPSAAPTAAPPSPAPTVAPPSGGRRRRSSKVLPDPCGAACEVEGKRGSCREQVAWFVSERGGGEGAATESMPHRAVGCEQKVLLVRNACPDCRECALAAVCGQ
ncbi:unnamed protein product [Prorocentrum cordatum]|uniref:Uncharacterized protein n=1 Tax=Prorocentrum cordatum TaxID=2364126 RepID=A0ABN9WEE1_9DINO|nr:unnamed protein product [Polarella glacialis]